MVNESSARRSRFSDAERKPRASLKTRNFPGSDAADNEERERRRGRLALRLRLIYLPELIVP